MKKKIYLGIAIIWFVVASAFIFGMSSSTKSDFDPQMRLSQALMNVEFEKILAEHVDRSLGAVEQNRKGRLLHITQGSCYCEFLAKAHQSNLDKWASSFRFESLNVGLQKHAWLKQYVPSTPAIMALDEQNRIIYFGPYSRGAGCFNQTGEIDVQLNAWIERDNASEMLAVIDTDAQGCYCEVEK